MHIVLCTSEYHMFFECLFILLIIKNNPLGSLILKGIKAGITHW